MEQVKYFNKNETTVVGTLVENNLEIKESREKKVYITGNIVLKTNIDGVEQLNEVSLFAFEFKKDSTEKNKLFQTYASLDDKIGTRIKVIGEIAENRFFQTDNEQLVSFNFNSGRWIYDANKDAPDQAKFYFEGYVVKPIREKLNKEGDLVNYEIVLGQANYNGSKPTFVKFIVDGSDERAQAYMERNYEKGTTVSVDGKYQVEVQINTKEVERAFGTPTVEEYTNVFKSFRILSGSEPVYGKNEYTTKQMRDFAGSYEDDGIRIQERAKERASENKGTSAKSTSATSLI